MTLWDGRFSQEMDPAAWAFNASITFDRRLALQDVRGSLAWADALQGAGVIDPAELGRISEGLIQIQEEINTGSFRIEDRDEDIHSAVERRLGELIGEAAGKLHTGRSRNDQVATDLRMWLLDHLPVLDKAIAGLQQALIARAEAGIEIIIPGYTHLQRAQPILLGHWWLSHFWPLHRDRTRLHELTGRTAILPLGAGALAGTPFPVDRVALAELLGFAQPSQNSLDAVSDRDFVAEFLFVAALLGVHISRLCESVVIFSTAEFGIFRLSERFATGSSLMPQKLNPDVFELARAKAGTLSGYLTGILGVLKGLPSTYDKDLQEDKLPVFQAFDNLISVLPVLSDALITLEVDERRAADLIDSGLMATDLADYLVRKGVPFRMAHQLAGQAVAMSHSKGEALQDLSIEEFSALSPAFERDVYEVFDPAASVARRSSYGSTAAKAVRVQINEAKSAISQWS